MKSKVYHIDKVETRQQFLQSINEAGTAKRNEMEMYQNIRY